MTTLEELRSEYDRLAGSRARELDAIGLAHAGRMLERVVSVPEVARERLLVRARAALDAVQRRADEAHGRGAERIDALERDGFEVSHLRARLARGEAGAVERRYRLTRALGREVRRRDPALEARLVALARAHGLETSTLPASASLASLAGRLFRCTAAEASAQLVLERARTNRPTEAGRYHTATVVSSVLLAMGDASPAYLRAQLARLELAAEMHRFLAAFEPIKEAPKPSGKSGKSVKSAARSTRSAKSAERSGADSSTKASGPPPQRPAKPRAKSTSRGKKR